MRLCAYMFQDELRDCGVQQWIQLPRICVLGTQSAGVWTRHMPVPHSYILVCGYCPALGGETQGTHAWAKGRSIFFECLLCIFQEKVQFLKLLSASIFFLGEMELLREGRWSCGLFIYRSVRTQPDSLGRDRSNVCLYAFELLLYLSMFELCISSAGFLCCCHGQKGQEEYVETCVCVHGVCQLNTGLKRPSLSSTTARTGNSRILTKSARRLSG